jgi:hypothetical protein
MSSVAPPMRRLSMLAACLCVSASLSSSAEAAPITVNLRVEGSSKTLFEGPVATEAILSPPGISTKTSPPAHPCDVKDNGGNGGFGVAAATPTAALYIAAVAHGLSFDAKWEEGTLHDFFVTQIGSDVNGGAPEFPSWGYAVNYTTAGVGGCQFQLAPGSEVLWAYNYFNLAHLLALSGPSSANLGSPVSVHVSDAQTGQPISGASLGEVVQGATTALAGSPATDANGNAVLTFGRPGAFTLKATRSDSVRSNGLAVCVHNGNDGTCGSSHSTGASGTLGSTSTPAAPVPSNSPLATIARVAGVKNGQHYPRRRAPRLLAGAVQLAPGVALRDVRIRLERRYRHRCFAFSGSREVFVRARTCGKAAFFSVGAAQSFSYLLPARLGPGRYVYAVEAIDAAGAATTLVPGVSQVAFTVRQ